MTSDTPTMGAVDKQEKYATTVLTMFLPFRDSVILRGESDNTYWSKLVDGLQPGGNLWNEGLQIMHNIEDRETSQKMKSAVEPLIGQTTYEKNNDEDNSTRKDERLQKSDPNAIYFSLFDDEDEGLIDGDYRVTEGCAKKNQAYPWVSNRLWSS